MYSAIQPGSFSLFIRCVLLLSNTCVIHVNPSSFTMPCKHDRQMLQPSNDPEQTGYHQSSEVQRARAASLENDPNLSNDNYPGPLVLPNDEISSDRRHPLQSLTEWNKLLTPSTLPCKRRMIYVSGRSGFTKDCPPLRQFDGCQEETRPK